MSEIYKREISWVAFAETLGPMAELRPVVAKGMLERALQNALGNEGHVDPAEAGPSLAYALTSTLKKCLAGADWSSSNAPDHVALFELLVRLGALRLGAPCEDASRDDHMEWLDRLKGSTPAEIADRLHSEAYPRCVRVSDHYRSQLARLTAEALVAENWPLLSCLTGYHGLASVLSQLDDDVGTWPPRRRAEFASWLNATCYSALAFPEQGVVDWGPWIRRKYGRAPRGGRGRQRARAKRLPAGRPQA